MKRSIIIVLIFSFVLGLSACDRPSGGSNDRSVRIVTDVWGRQVPVPETVTRIVCLGSGAPRLAAYLNVMGLAVGAEDHDIRELTALRDYSPVHHRLLSGLPSVGAGGGSGGNNGYPEQLVALAPDVILAGFSAEAADELQAQTSIPVVAVRYISHGLADETFYRAMRVFAETVGVQARCEEVLGFIDQCKADLAERTEGIPAAEKPTVYPGAVTFSGRHGFTGTYSDFGPLAILGARNVADTPGHDGYYETDLEQALIWNPDVIFLDPGNLDLVKQELAAHPGVLDALGAVRTGQVYTLPSFNHCGTNITYALMNAYYAGTILYPARFADVDIAEKSAEILTFFLGENTYDQMAAQGLYYGKILLGEQ